MFVTGFLGSFALVILACILLCRFVVYPAFLSPLSKIPAVHPTARCSSLWMNWQRYHHNELNTLFQAHKKHGPVVLVGPSDISINCVKGGLQTVYLGGFEKPDWYENIFVNFGNTTRMANMVSFMDHHSHSIRKRIVSNIYSKSTILSSVALKDVTQTIIQERFVPFLRSAANNSTDVDVYSLFGGAAMDVVTGYLFGLSASTDFTTNEAERRRFHDLYFSRRGPDFWLQFPNLVQTLKRHFAIKLIPDRMTDATLKIEAFVLSMCDKAATLSQQPAHPPADQTAPSHHPTVHAHLSAALAAQSPAAAPSALRLALASELMDHTVAGYETSTVTLTYLAWHLSRRPSLQRCLRAALRALPPDDPRALDALPLLHALVYETLRLHTGAPGPQARVTPHVAGGTVLGPPGKCYAGIPGGVRVAANAWCIHRNAEVFPEPEAWRPERWLDGRGEVLRVGKAEGPSGGGGEKGGGEYGEEERAREMGRWFWAFGSGGRVCVGSHLALYQIKHVVAALYANFKTEIVDDEGIEQEDHFLAHPKGHKLILRLKEINQLA